MITLRKATDRFHTNIDWLDSWHTFSFGEHHDDNHVHFGPLRVINDDRIAGGGGFPTHGHRDMEIITIVLEGVLEHKDSIGNGAPIRPGDVQKMSAGLGILHSEFNGSQEHACHLLQIWIMPNVTGVAPGYQQVHFDPATMKNHARLVASPSGADGSITLVQDARIYMASVDAGATLTHPIPAGRGLWAHVATGAGNISGHDVTEGDGLAFVKEKALTFTASAPSKIILFDVKP